MLSNWNIGERLSFAFLITLLLVGIVAATGFWGLWQMVSTIDSILDRDAKTMQFASDLEARTLAMRRFEKDVFLNIGDHVRVAAYAEKWRDARAHAAADLDTLRRRSDVADEAQVVAMQKSLATYAAGFEDVLRGIDAGAIVTPAAANIAIEAFDDDLHRLDTASVGFAGKNIERMNANGVVVSDAALHTRGTMGVICIAVFLMTVLITRSITAPILEVVDLAKKLADRQNGFDVPQRNDETGMLLAAMKKMVDSKAR